MAPKSTAASLTELLNFGGSFFTDDHDPLAYRFSMYATQNDLERDVVQGSLALQRAQVFLADYDSATTFSSALPRSYYNSTLQQYQDTILVVQVKDGLGATSNRTVNVRITPTDYSSRREELEAYQQLFQSITRISDLAQQATQLDLLSIELERMDQINCPSCSGRGSCADSAQSTCACDAVEGARAYFLRDCSASQSDYALYTSVKKSAMTQ